MLFDPSATPAYAAGKMANRAGFVDTGPRPQAKAWRLLGLAQAAAAIVALVFAHGLLSSNPQRFSRRHQVQDLSPLRSHSAARSLSDRR